MRSLLLLLALPITIPSAEPQQVLETEVLLFPRQNGCYCGVRGAVHVRNGDDQEITLDAKLNPPPGWFSDPSDLSMTLAAGSSAVTEFRIVMGLPFVPNTWPPYMPQITVHDGAIVVSLSASADGERLKVVSSKEYLLKDALCLLPGEPLCH